MTAADKFRRLLQDDPRYNAEAYNFVYEALDWTLKHVLPSGPDDEHQHVSGPELLEGVRQYAINQFGCLARTVLASWGVHATADFGEIVFNLVEYDLMGKQESDTKEDFHGVYDFEDAFDLGLVLRYQSERDEWQAAYIPRGVVHEEG